MPCRGNLDSRFSRGVLCSGAQLRTHGLRHTHLTNLPREGVHPKIASERAALASVSVTLDIYSHAVPGLQHDAAAKVDAALRKPLRE